MNGASFRTALKDVLLLLARIAQDSIGGCPPMPHQRSCRRSLLLLAWWQRPVDGRLRTRRHCRRWPDGTDPLG